MVYILSPFFFPLQNAVCFIILTYLVPVLFTFYMQGVLKLKKKNNSGSKRLKSKKKQVLRTNLCIGLIRNSSEILTVNTVRLNIFHW